MPSRKKRTPLSRERIELAALDLIEAGGLQAFSIRKLAAELHCEAMSIYHYFPSKGHIMDALVDHVIDEFPPFPDPSLPWKERVSQIGRDWRRTTTRRPNLFLFVATHRMNTPKALAYLDAVIALFGDGGLDEETAIRVFRSFGYYLMGAGLDETAGYARGPSTVAPVPQDVMQREYPHVAAAGRYFRPEEFDRTFEFGWSLLISSLESLRKDRCSPDGELTPSRRHQG